MNNYVKLVNDINHFDGICSCFNNFYYMGWCCVGFLFPQCLFGRTYELLLEGDCCLGCCKIFLLGRQKHYCS